ncbi:MFS transporter [Cohnella endophytica]|uniref:MFS transporter n=1 Tax=Cohnella endophytica TaxID=2419778 RepID=A0A494XPD4_9BACL|nr:sugar efflux transporter [Cohnella endophytica]RKP51601.1 MFS transporter [Cohnella endophytica]
MFTIWRKISGVKSQAVKLFQLEGWPTLILINVLIGISVSFVMPFNSLFGIDEVGMSNMAFGIFMTISAIANVIISTYIGKISDGRMDRRTVMILCAIAGAIGYACYAYSRNYYVLLVISSLVLGIASSSSSQMFAYAREMFTKSDLPPKEAPFYMNLFRTFFALAWTVGPAIAAYVMIYLGFTGLFLLSAAMYVIVVLVLLFFMKGTPERVQNAQLASTQPQISLGKVIMRPFILGNLIAFSFVSAAFTVSSMNMSQFLTKVLHTGQEQIGIVFSIPPIFEIPFMLFFGVLATRIDNRILIRLGVLFAFAFFASLFFVQNVWQVYLVQILSAAAISITNGIAITYFQNFIPNMPGVATSLYMNTSKIGQTFAFLVFGFASEWFGYRNVYLVCTLFVGIGLVLLFSLGKKNPSDAALATGT